VHIGPVAVLAQGLGVPHLMDISLWLLAVMTVATVLQRIFAVAKSAREAA